jgi:hypothetical protein
LRATIDALRADVAALVARLDRLDAVERRTATKAAPPVTLVG